MADEIRGVWITIDDSNVLKSEDNLREALKKLKDYGFNTIYPAVWHSGHTLYPSEVAKDFMGVAVKPDPNFASRDLMKELVEVSKELSFRLIPWFEFGLMVTPNSPIDELDAKFKDLITRTSKGDKIRNITDSSGKLMRDKSGKVVRDPFIWINPCHSEVQNFMVKLIAEIAEKYDIDGIQLDDHFGWPKELGFDKLARDTYEKEKKKDGRVRDWETWASDKITELVEKIFKAVKAQRSTCLISISPQPWGFSKKNYRLDWRTWERDGYAEEIVLQNYVSANFTHELKQQEVKDARSHIPTIIGIITGVMSDKSPVPLSTVKQQIKETRERKFAGVSFFFCESFFNELSSPGDPLTSKVSPRNETELEKVFD